jgi:hypothetical protein
MPGFRNDPLVLMKTPTLTPGPPLSAVKGVCDEGPYTAANGAKQAKSS